MIVKLPVAAPVTLSPSESVATMTDEKSIEDTDVVPAALVRRSKFSAFAASSTWSSWSFRSNDQEPLAFTVSVNT